METKKLFAIYKNGSHLGNSNGETAADAVNTYLKQANYIYLLSDSEFVSLYIAKIAVKGVHYA